MDELNGRDWRILIGDTRDGLRALPEQSVHVCATSPPYWGLRAYGTDPQIWGGEPGCEHEWGETKTTPCQTGGMNGKQATHPGSVHYGHEHQSCVQCGAWRGELGSEPTPELFVSHLVEVFDGVHRVLRDDGTLWVNLGDSYNAYNGNRGPSPSISGTNGEKHPVHDRGLMAPGLKPKDLCGVPWMFAFAMRAHGWYLRSEITWGKTSPMPESVRDRPTNATEKIFLFTKRDRYFYDQDACRVPSASATLQRDQYSRITNGKDGPYAVQHDHETPSNPSGRNLWNYWLIGPEPCKEAHFAVFPSEIPRRAILLGTSEKGCCAACGAPWMRVVEQTATPRRGVLQGYDWREHRGNEDVSHQCRPNGQDWKRNRAQNPPKLKGWQPTCDCGADVEPCTVLDCFGGSGTTVRTAIDLGRRGVMTELNPAYAEIARKRITARARTEKPIEPLPGQKALF